MEAPPTDDEAPPTEEEQMLAALRMKADAFANKEWEAYWLREGPALLTAGWLSSHPTIPLTKVKEVCSLDFLSSAINSLSLESGGQDGGSHSTDALVATSFKEGGNLTEGSLESKLDYSEMEVSSAHDQAQPATESEEASADVMKTAGSDGEMAAKLEEDVSMETAIGSEAIAAMWNEHYNWYYWYMYQVFVQQQETQQMGREEGEREGEMEEEGEREKEEDGEVEESQSQDSEALEDSDKEVSPVQIM